MCITNIVSHNKPHVYSKGKANGRPLCSYNCYLFVLSLHVSLVSVMCFCSSRALKGSLGIGARLPPRPSNLGPFLEKIRGTTYKCRPFIVNLYTLDSRL